MSRDISWRNDFRNPAAAALKNRRVIRDARASNAQITAEQLIANAKELESVVGTAKPATRVLLTSPEEVAMYRQRLRAEYEGQLKQGYKILSKWLEYAEWEESQKDLVRAASIYERAKGPHAERTEYWRAYAEFQVRSGRLEDARAVFSRGVTVLPQSDELWLKYLLLEQAAMEDERVRDLFQRWLAAGRPGSYAWELAIQFEASRGDVERGRQLLARYVVEHNTSKAWVFYAKTEQHGFNDSERATEVLITALEALPDRYCDSSVYALLGRLLRDAGRLDEARRVYMDFTENAKYEQASRLFADYSRLERDLAASSGPDSSGNGGDVVTLAQARLRYQKDVDRKASNFDAWLSLALVEHNASDDRGARNKALGDGSQVPLQTAEAKDTLQLTKKASLALGAAQALLQGGDVEASRQLLSDALQSFPHSIVAYPPLWIEAAELERQQGDIAKARKIFGAALGLCPHPSLFRAYRRLEQHEQTPEMNSRLRKIFDAQVAKFPFDVSLWVEYATFETSEEEHLRSDAILAAALRVFMARVADFSKDRSIMDDVDALWMARIRLSLQRSTDDGDASGAPTTIELFRQLVEFSFHQYSAEYEAWRQEHLEKGTPGMPPRFLPKALAVGAVERLAESIRAMIQYAAQAPKTTLSSSSAIEMVRELLSALTDKARSRGNAWVEKDAGQELSFLHLQDSKYLVELFLAPIYREWTAFELQHGDEASLKAVTTSAEAPVKKRTRLFKK